MNSPAVIENKLVVDSEEAMLDFGRELGPNLLERGISRVYLVGDLGAGKTTLCRGILSGLGYQGKVRSPTYTLLESYQTPNGYVYHFDLYRMNHPEELEFIGSRDYFIGGNLCLVEWPEKGTGWLPPPELIVRLNIQGSKRQVALEWHN